MTTSDGALATQVECGTCDAVCCRLPVVLMPDDDVAGHLATRTAEGLRVMARDEDGWCVALDSAHMRCSIYASRPAICRSFRMGGAHCLDVRADYADHRARGIPLTLY
ncbi:YkgJ family cysteine cluster protein [Agrilutibacter solisilvae]|uniref:YkgJ family cysteine cluster protein n=1 Tax=Agrilutibacter solisilvae TaxID=2763317 RepID=A0A974XZN3_9GAMM|nr:YkgJ family cysteine cluster protein [Lysobacter solisilvae]QSX77868.1 YkgJ family cysteine cluster protein [Lysobacter solisilvae]